MGQFSSMAHTARVYMVDLADRLCGCRHRKTTMPITLRPDATAGGSQNGREETFIVCLECGRRVAYDLRTMSVAKRWSGFMRKRPGANAWPGSGRNLPR